MKKQLTIEEHQANYEKFISTFQKKEDILHYLDSLHLLFIASKEREEVYEEKLDKKTIELNQAEELWVKEVNLIDTLNARIDSLTTTVSDFQQRNITVHETIDTIERENQSLKEQLEHAQYRLINLMMALTTPTKEQLRNK